MLAGEGIRLRRHAVEIPRRQLFWGDDLHRVPGATTSTLGLSELACPTGAASATIRVRASAVAESAEDFASAGMRSPNSRVDWLNPIDMRDHRDPLPTGHVLIPTLTRPTRVPDSKPEKCAPVW